MTISQVLIAEGRRFPQPNAAMMERDDGEGQPVRVIESRAGRIVVQHEDGYVFVFQIHDLEDLVMDLEDVTWSTVGAPPDADDLERQARDAAEIEARARGWLA